jgi:hypothetical protein
LAPAHTFCNFIGDSSVLKIDFFIRTGMSNADQCLIWGNPPKRLTDVLFCVTNHVQLSELCVV